MPRRRLCEGGSYATPQMGDETTRKITFSNDWKTRSKIFQRLEKSARNFPTIGKVARARERSEMELVADTHVHIYPVHDAAGLIRSCADRLRGQAQSPDAVCALFLTEGKGFHFFDRLRDGSHGLPDAFRVAPAAEPEAVRVTWGDQASAWIFAGRQIVTAERLEILALTSLDGIPDGAPTGRTVEGVHESGAIPVLSWAPGKWFFQRGDVVRDVIEGHAPGHLLIGDTALRPTLWPEPSLMKTARCKGLAVLAGSDPLPFAGDETQAGGYGVRGDLDFDKNKPVSSVRKWLTDPNAYIERMGKRNGPVEMLARMMNHRKSKKDEVDERRT